VKIIYQGGATETSAPDLAGFLREKGIEARLFLIEVNDRVLSSDSTALNEVELQEGDQVNLYQIVPGG
jgi:sulfur carrier protein ThiS